MADIFISYARGDRDRIEKLAGALESEGYSVWWDRQIVGGREFSEEIERELDAAGAVIVAWSETSVKSRWVKDEAATAAEAGKLIPVAIDGASAPMGYKQFHIIDLARWKGDAEAPDFTDLKRAIDALASGEAVAASPARPEGVFAQLRKRLSRGTPLMTAITSLIVLGIVLVGMKFAWPDGGNPDLADTSAPESAAQAAGAPDQAPVAATSRTGAGPDSASIAVLPFADLSPDGDQAYFSDGIAEEILNVLAGVGSLSVASRTSAFGFKGQEALGIPVMAEKLNVRYVLEGSVRKSGDAVRITAQLIDARNDAHLWSQTFDRTLTAENLFSIQDDIASAIVDKLGVMIDGSGGNAPQISVAADTSNIDAYEKFLEARAQFVMRDNNRLPKIIDDFEQSVAADPDFARGWAGLSAAYGVAPGWALFDRNYLELSDAAAARAIALNPDLALPYAVLGNNLVIKLPGDFVRAIEYYNEALRRDPNDVESLQWRAEAFIVTGFFDLAAKDTERCLDVAPQYSQCLLNDAKIKLFKGELDEAFAAFEYATGQGAVGAGEWHFPLAYALIGDDRAVLLSVSSIFHRYDVLNGRSERHVRAMTDPDFDFERETAELEIEIAAFFGGPFEWDDTDAFVFRMYEKLKPKSQRASWWYWFVPEFMNSPHRKRLIRESGIYDYWRAAGFPPQCRAVSGKNGGDDDFECSAPGLN